MVVKSTPPQYPTDGIMIDYLRSMGLSDAAIGKTLLFSGSNGPRDIESFLSGRSKNIDARRERLQTLYTEHVRHTAPTYPSRPKPEAPAKAKPALWPDVPETKPLKSTAAMIDKLRAIGLSDQQDSPVQFARRT